MSERSKPTGANFHTEPTTDHPRSDSPSELGYRPRCSVDSAKPSGQGRWKQRDSAVQVLHYQADTYRLPSTAVKMASGEGAELMGEWKMIARIWKMTCTALALATRTVLTKALESNANNSSSEEERTRNLAKTCWQNLHFAKCSMESLP